MALEVMRNGVRRSLSIFNEGNSGSIEITKSLAVCLWFTRLRRVFLLINCEHGVKSSDEQLLAHLRQMGTPHQIIISKVDKVLVNSRNDVPGLSQLEKLREVVEDIRDKVRPEGLKGAKALGEILCCSCRLSDTPQSRLGIASLRWAVLQACGLECDDSGRGARKIVLQTQSV